LLLDLRAGSSADQYLGEIFMVRQVVAAIGLAAATSFTPAALTAAGTDEYEFVPVALPDNCVDSAGFGISDRGWIVGSCGGGPFTQGFVDTARTFQIIDNLPGGEHIWYATGVNAKGTIIGQYARGTFVVRGSFIDQGGRFSKIEIPGLPQVLVGGINNRGVIVGAASQCEREVCPVHGFVRSPEGEITLLDLAPKIPNPNTYFFGINNKGAIVGQYNSAAGTGTSFLRAPNGVMTTIAVPGAAQTRVSGINNARDVVGTYRRTAAEPTQHGFVLNARGFLTIDFPGASSTELGGINNFGELVGSYSDTTGQHTFVARPHGEDEE
jgi:hypothetical protein